MRLLPALLLTGCAPYTGPAGIDSSSAPDTRSGADTHDTAG